MVVDIVMNGCRVSKFQAVQLLGYVPLGRNYLDSVLGVNFAWNGTWQLFAWAPSIWTAWKAIAWTFLLGFAFQAIPMLGMPYLGGPFFVVCVGGI